VTTKTVCKCVTGIWICAPCRQAIQTAIPACAHNVEVFDGFIGAPVNLCRLTGSSGMTEDMDGCDPGSRGECPR
jgi:hypothetical protein